MDNMNGGFNPNDMNNNNGMNNANNSMNTMNNTNGGFNPNGMNNMNGGFNPNGMNNMNGGFNPNGMNNFGFNPMNQMGGGPGLAIASMVLGIVSVTVCCGGWIGLIAAVLAIVLGGVALKKQTRGRGMGIAGVACGIVGVVFYFLWSVFAVEYFENLFEDLKWDYM